MSNLTEIVDELRTIIAQNNSEKDNITLDILDGLNEAITTLSTQNIELTKSINNKQQPINIVNNLDKVETLLIEVVSTLSAFNSKLIINNGVVLDKIIGALELLSKATNKQELDKISKSISDNSIKPELEKLNSTLSNKEESWSFTINRDTQGNMTQINAKRLK